ncbi:hypothetical protein EDB86DRAFT_1406097 [Lactarius hatsudake]|nr:hypothetical protein EDB86DRAFT_1406097 [Lactarius hatsudake]
MASSGNAHGDASSRPPAIRQANTPKPKSTPLTTSPFLQDRPDNGSAGVPQIAHNDHESRNNPSSAVPAGGEKDTRLRGTNGLLTTFVGAPPEREQDTPGTTNQSSSPESSQAGCASETEQRTEAGEVTSSMGTETGTSQSTPHQPSTKKRRYPSRFRRLIMRIQRCFGRRHSLANP